MLDLVKTPVGRLRLAGYFEGGSYLALLFLAMPLKYIWKMPHYVELLGPIHGVFFVLFIMTLMHAFFEYDWPIKTALAGFISSLLPFGPFLFDRFFIKED